MTIFLLVVIYIAFISLGLPDSVLGVAWPSMRETFGQPVGAVGLVTFVLTLCSALSGFASGRVLKKLGTGPVVMISGFLTGSALLGFSLVPSFWWLIVLSIPLGLGAGAVDAGLNHFVAAHYSSRHMNWLHGFWGVGATVGPLLMSAGLRGDGWASGYRSISIIQLALAGVFLATLPLWNREKGVAHSSVEEFRKDTKEIPRWTTWVAPSLYLIYAAIELGTGLWAASILVSDRGLDKATAGVWVSFFYGAITAGRFALGLFSDKVGNRLLVRLGLIVTLIGAALFVWPGLPAQVSLAALILIGLGCSPIYPCLMHETPRRFDADTARSVVGRQVAFAYVGGAVMPALFGLVAATAGLGSVMPGIAVAAVLLFVLSEKLNRAT